MPGAWSKPPAQRSGRILPNVDVDGHAGDEAVTDGEPQPALEPVSG
jgi:hypothetical protein